MAETRTLRVKNAVGGYELKEGEILVIHEEGFFKVLSISEDRHTLTLEPTDETPPAVHAQLLGPDHWQPFPPSEPRDG